MSPARARTRTTRSGVERTNHEATAPPTCTAKANHYLESLYISQKNIEYSHSVLQLQLFYECQVSKHRDFLLYAKLDNFLNHKANWK